MNASHSETVDHARRVDEGEADRRRRVVEEVANQRHA